MAKLLRKFASRIKGSKSQPDVSCYMERHRGLNKPDPLIQGMKADASQAPPSTIEEEDIIQYHRQDERQNRLKFWSNRLRKAARINRMATSHSWDQPVPARQRLENTTPTRLLSLTASSCTTTSHPESPPPGLHTVHEDNIIQPSFSESTADVESEFGFTMQRMRCGSGQQAPRLYLDMSRQSNTLSPFRPFSPGVLLPSGSYDPATGASHRYVSTSSFDRYRNPSDTTIPPIVGNRFYSQANLDALGVNRAPTVDSGLSPALNPFASSPSFKSMNTNRSLSGGVTSLSIVSKSTAASRNTTPSFSLASPISFC